MNKSIIEKIKAYVKERMSGESTGHDWYHVERVYKMATRIARHEKKADLLTVQAAALLHDLGDWKVNSTGLSEEQVIEKACKNIGLEKDVAARIKEIILNMSFSKNVEGVQELSLEGKIVQDADRLEALGAIGIARAFAYGGKKNREIYNPNEKPKKYGSIEEYRNSQGHTINHFYEKLFTLKDLMNTEYARKIAGEREEFMKTFLEQFYKEWECEE